MAEYANIRVRPKTKNAADKLAEKYEMNLLDLYASMVEYFEKTGVHPKDRTVLSPAEELKKFRDTIVSFMRKQEKDFILPVFSQMNALAVRFSEYIENEAPKSKEKAKVGSVPTLSQSKVDLSSPGQEKTETTPTQTVDVTQNEEYKTLKAEHEMLQVKYNTLSQYYAKIVNNIKQKSTGMSKGPVVDLPLADINDFKEYLRLL